MRVADERLWLRLFRARMHQHIAALRIEAARGRLAALRVSRAAWDLRRAGAGTLLLLVALALPASGAYKLVGGKISTQTTTTLIAAVSGQAINVYAYSFCVDGNGATTSFTFQDSGGTNLLGTGYIAVVNPGQCLAEELRYNGAPRYGVTVSLGLQLVTGTGNGPVEWQVEYGP